MLIIYCRGLNLDNGDVLRLFGEEKRERSQTVARAHFADVFSTQIQTARGVLCQAIEDKGVSADNVIDRLREDRRRFWARRNSQGEANLPPK